MRISDWSSDVCCSDLQRAFELARIFRVDAEIGGKFHRAADALRDVDEGAVGKDGAVQRGEIIVVHRHDLPQPRSEEHTSELQSLMRISYAVFCLKKKK